MNAALRAREGLNENSRALKHIEELKRVKAEIEDRARGLGYARACKESIPVCKGACCKWHFPKDLNFVDFLAAVHGLPPEARKKLADKLQDFHDEIYQCPLLMEDGCILSFDHRPIACTIAYPCAMGQSYWAFLQEKRAWIKKIYLALAEITQELGKIPQNSVFL